MSWTLNKGKWFWCFGYIVFPVPKASVPWFCVIEPAEARTAVAEWLASKAPVRFYSWQPNWSLKDVGANSLQEARKVVAEFLEFTHLAAEEFTLELLLSSRDLCRHAWKHTVFRHIDAVLEAVEPGKTLFPALLLSQMGPDPKRLFRKAAGRDVEAVTRVSYLFQSSKEKMLEAAGVIFDGKTAQALVSRIPTVEELAAELASKAIRDPDSQEAEDARSQLKSLTSKAATRGVGRRVGRHPMPYDRETVELVFEISHALQKQLIAVNSFLDRFFLNDREKRNELEKYFADLTRLLGGRLNPFLEDEQATHRACTIAGEALKVSPSKVAKTVYQRTTRSASV